MDTSAITPAAETPIEQLQTLDRPAIKPTRRIVLSRDGYGALRLACDPGGANRTRLGRAWAMALEVLGELEAGDVDEHRAPAWQTGIAWNNRKNRGQAVNVSLYGVDLVAGQPLAVVQVRQFTRNSGAQRAQALLVARTSSIVSGAGLGIALPMER